MSAFKVLFMLIVIILTLLAEISCGHAECCHCMEVSPYPGGTADCHNLNGGPECQNIICTVGYPGYGVNPSCCNIAWTQACVDEATQICYDTYNPTSDPTPAPTNNPTPAPTADPTTEPTADPTLEPTTEATPAPSNNRTADPTSEPTTEPSQASTAASCNYVYSTAPPEGHPIAMDVCREIVVNGVLTWRKYKCDGIGGSKVLDLVYDNNRANCNGNLVSIQDVTSHINSFECGVEGTGNSNCEYIMRQQPCDPNNPPITYSVEPVITGQCIQFTAGFMTRSFEWECNNGVAGQVYAPQSGDCSGVEIAVPFNPGVCGISTGLAAEAKYCETKVYGPTPAPTPAPTPTTPAPTTPAPTTPAPTTEPTLNPTPSPTISIPTECCNNCTEQYNNLQNQIEALKLLIETLINVEPTTYPTMDPIPPEPFDFTIYLSKGAVTNSFGISYILFWDEYVYHCLGKNSSQLIIHCETTTALHCEYQSKYKIMIINPEESPITIDGITINLGSISYSIGDFCISNSFLEQQSNADNIGLCRNNDFIGIPEWNRVTVPDSGGVIIKFPSDLFAYSSSMEGEVIPFDIFQLSSRYCDPADATTTYPTMDPTLDPTQSSECSHAPNNGVCGSIPHLLFPVSTPYSSCSYGQCIYVSSSSSCSSGCGSSNNPWKTIQAAIDNNNYGESTIIVSPGIYTGSGNYDIFAQYASIKIYSESGPDNTIIDCGGNGYGFYLKHGTVEIKGVTIQNCVASQRTLAYTVGDTPISGRFGGAFSIHQLTATFTDVIIRENDAEYGGAIFSYQATLVFRNSNIYRNCASQRGGGIYSFQGSTSIENTILSCNDANDAGGIYNYQTSTNIILQSKISNNDARRTANEYYCDSASVSIDSGNGMAMIFDNDIASWNNNEITYCRQCSMWGNGQNFCVSTGGYSTTPIISIWTITVIISCCLLILGAIYLTYKNYRKLNNNNKYDYDAVKYMDSEEVDESEINQININ